MEQLLPELTPLIIGSVAFLIGLIVVLAQRRLLHVRSSRQADAPRSSAA